MMKLSSHKYLYWLLLLLIAYCGINVWAVTPDFFSMDASAILIEKSSLESANQTNLYQNEVTPVSDSLVQQYVNQKSLEKLTTTSDSISYAKHNQNFAQVSINQAKGEFHLNPDYQRLMQQKSILLKKETALKTATNLIAQTQLLPNDFSETIAHNVVYTAKADATKNETKPATDIMQTVYFQRYLDNRPVMGKGSKLQLSFGHQGELVGINRVWQKANRIKFTPEYKTETEIYQEIIAQLTAKYGTTTKILVKAPKLVYYDNNQKYIQPAYYYVAEIPSPIGNSLYLYGIIAALKNTPEPIDQKKTTIPQNLNKTTASSSYSIGPSVGRYVVREDSWDWVDDANDFYNGLNNGHPSDKPSITFGDYYWAEPRMFTNEDASFADRWNVTLVEGHGAPWLFTTKSNNADMVDLNASTQPGYGDLNMRYFVLKSCSVIPCSIDRANWPDPWWRIFQGLRQAIGFRTMMFINDDISDDFGYKLAQGYRVIDAWFQATDSCSAYWDQRNNNGNITGYGSIIMVSGNDNDTIYNIERAPIPGSLTVVFQHK